MAPSGFEPVERGESLAERAHAAIRRAIRDGSLVPNEIYSDGELGRSMGISRTPVREAVKQLAHEGVLEVLPQRGFRVREISMADAEEIFGLRQAIEGFVVERLARDLPEGAIAELRDAIARQKKVVEDTRAFLEIDESFHLRMAELAGLRRAHQMLTILRGEMWLAAIEALATPGRSRVVLDEHASIVDALEAGDARAARRAMTSHLKVTAAVVRR
jgi:GntR family transcriptional regulator, rspAB operon transcriptional repressor